VGTTVLHCTPRNKYFATMHQTYKNVISIVTPESFLLLQM
jgi:hypothetical protein